MTRSNKSVGINSFPNVDELTPSEKKVYELYMQGMSKADIGEQLCMKPASVSRRLYTAKEKAHLQAALGQK